VVKCGALETLVLRANLLVASNKANLKQGNDGLIAMKDIFHQIVNQTLELRDVLSVRNTVVSASNKFSMYMFCLHKWYLFELIFGQRLEDSWICISTKFQGDVSDNW
jgi:hypothetical protein